jgi:hypothetical protein
LAIGQAQAALVAECASGRIGTHRLLPSYHDLDDPFFSLPVRRLNYKSIEQVDISPSLSESAALPRDDQANDQSSGLVSFGPMSSSQNASIWTIPTKSVIMSIKRLMLKL